MNGKHYTAVVFDLDGTLLNTLSDLHASVNTALAHFGMPQRTADEVRTFLGYGYRYLISHCAPEGTAETDIDTVLKYFEDYYYSHSMDTTCPYPGIPQTVSRLAQAGYRLAIVSNKGMAAVRELARHFFGGEIEVAIGESAEVRRKPAPDAALMAMDTLKAPREATLYVGDSEVDIETARNAGIDCLSVSWGFRTRQRLADAGASWIADYPEDIFEFVQAH